MRPVPKLLRTILLLLGRIAMRRIGSWVCVVCLLITTAIPAETDEPIEVSIWIRTRVGPGNHVLGRSQIPNRNGHFLGGFLPRFACGPYSHYGWLGSRVVSVLDSGAEGPWFKSQPQRCSHPLCLCSPSSKIGSSPLKGCGGNCRPGGK